MPLLNVRLSPGDVRRAAELRKAGIQISDVVREAIRAEYARLRSTTGNKQRASRIVKAILEALPDPPDVPRIAVLPKDRQAVRRHVAAKLRRA